jgi:hypothetical protein
MDRDSFRLSLNGGAGAETMETPVVQMLLAAKWLRSDGAEGTPNCYLSFGPCQDEAYSQPQSGGNYESYQKADRKIAGQQVMASGSGNAVGRQFFGDNYPSNPGSDMWEWKIAKSQESCD